MSETKQCPLPASYNYYWAGQSEISYACVPHATQLAKLCEHMGWNQPFELMRPGVFEQCRQQLSVDDPIFAEHTPADKPE